MEQPKLPDLETICPHCGGSGYVTNPVWIEWLKKRKQNPDLPMPDEDEEVKCGECDGIGMVPTEAGKALLDFLYMYFIPAVERKNEGKARFYENQR